MKLSIRINFLSVLALVFLSNYELVSAQGVETGESWFDEILEKVVKNGGNNQFSLPEKYFGNVDLNVIKGDPPVLGDAIEIKKTVSISNIRESDKQILLYNTTHGTLATLFREKRSFPLLVDLERFRPVDLRKEFGASDSFWFGVSSHDADGWSTKYYQSWTRCKLLEKKQFDYLEIVAGFNLHSQSPVSGMPIDRKAIGIQATSNARNDDF